MKQTEKARKRGKNSGRERDCVSIWLPGYILDSAKSLAGELGISLSEAIDITLERMWLACGIMENIEIMLESGMSEVRFQRGITCRFS